MLVKAENSALSSDCPFMGPTQEKAQFQSHCLYLPRSGLHPPGFPLVSCPSHQVKPAKVCHFHRTCHWTAHLPLGASPLSRVHFLGPVFSGSIFLPSAHYWAKISNYHICKFSVSQCPSVWNLLIIRNSDLKKKFLKRKTWAINLENDWCMRARSALHGYAMKSKCFGSICQLCILFLKKKKTLLGQGKNSMLLILFIYVFMYVPMYVFI